MAGADDIAADFGSHHIEGFARAAIERGQSGRFRVPLISHVDGNLWQGGCINGVQLPADFRYVVSLYPWERYKLPAGCGRLEVRMYDSLDQAFDQVDGIAETVNTACAKGKTLVHCQAGLNRSGLIAARALMLRGTHTAAEAIELLRAKRSPVVLCNAAFERYLLALDEPKVKPITCLGCGGKGCGLCEGRAAA
jgi:protein-tyrosine phosphatase